jgi:hypothetical protein
MARLIAIMGQLSGDPPSAAALHLLYLVAALANLAALRHAQQRRAQATAARSAASDLRAIAARTGHSSTPTHPLPASATGNP